MDIETRIVRQISRTKGTLTDSSGKLVPIHFDLTQTQAIIDGIPRQRTASGTLEFANRADADLMYDSPEAKTLKGGDIRHKCM